MNRKSWFEVFSESYNNGIHSGTDGSETNQNWLDTHFPGNGAGEGDTPDYGQLNHPQGPPQIDDPSVYDELDGDGESNSALPYGEQGVDSDHANGMAHAASLFDLFASDVAGEGANYITNSVETQPKKQNDKVINEQNIINNPQGYGVEPYLPEDEESLAKNPELWEQNIHHSAEVVDYKSVNYVPNRAPLSYSLNHLRYRPKISTHLNPFTKSAREIKDYSLFENPGDAPHVPVSKERSPQEPEHMFDMLQPAPLGKKKPPAFSRYTEDDKDAPRANPSLYSQNSIRQKPYRDEEAREGSNVSDIMYPDEVEIKHRRSTEDFGTKDPSSDDTMANSPTKGYSGSDMDNHLFSGIDRSASLFDVFATDYQYGKSSICRKIDCYKPTKSIFCDSCRDRKDVPSKPPGPIQYVDKPTQNILWNADPRNKKASLLDLFAKKNDTQVKKFENANNPSWVKQHPGRPTATVPSLIKLPVSYLKTLPGLRGEDRVLTLDMPKVKALAKLVPNLQWQREHPVEIGVQFDGKAYVDDGNHRIRAAIRANLPDLLCQIKFYGGGEKKSDILKKRASQEGLCYETAGRHLLKSEHGGNLVHGVCDIGEGPVNHAWVDEGKVQGIYEPESASHLSHQDFNDKYKPKSNSTYSKSDMVKNMLKSNHWGPWGNLKKQAAQDEETRPVPGKWMQHIHAKKGMVDLLPISWVKKFQGNDLRYDVTKPDPYDNVHTNSLLDSVKQNGIDEPLIMEIGQKDRKVLLGEGNHRLHAAEMAGFTHVPVHVMRRSTQYNDRAVPYDKMSKVPSNDYFPANAAPRNVFDEWSHLGSSPSLTQKADYGHVPPAVNPNSGTDDEDAQGDQFINQSLMTDGKIFPGYRENENETDVGRQQTKQRRYYNPNEVNQNYYNFSGSAGPFGKESDGIHSGIEPSN